MRATWYGHASFRLEDDGFAIVTDPFTPGYLGHPPVEDEADAVVISSADDKGHNHWEGIGGDPVVVNAMEHVGRQVALPNGSILEAMEVLECVDRPSDDPPKPNAMYRFTLDGVRIGHMGDVGDWLTEEQTEFFRDKIDVLLAPTGKLLTIPLEGLDQAIEDIHPRVVIPMHVHTPMLKYPFAPVEDFLERRTELDEDVVHVEGSTYEVTADTLPERRTVVVLQASHG